MMKGLDCSHWQGAIQWNKTNVSFAIIKCSQGTGFIDPMFNANKVRARGAGILLGFYHYANGDDPIAEANHFVTSAGGMLQGEFLVLDFEIKISKPVEWCKKFLDETQKLVGFKPLIYLNSYTAGKFDWTPVIKGDYGLWIANYGRFNLPYVIGKPEIGKWPFYAIWQYSSRGKINGINGYADLNYTKCSRKTLEKYGKLTNN